MSCNDNQSHLVRAGRTTSRVLAPSGGGQSSLTFGILPQKPVVKEETSSASVIGNATGNLPVEKTTENADNVMEEKVPVAAGETAASSNTTSNITGIPVKQLPVPVFTSAILPSQDDAPISSNAFVTGSNMNGGCVMTGRPSSRVLAPPGGHTSFKLG